MKFLCYSIALKDIMIYAGTINLKQPKSIHKVEEKILHEDYKNIAPKKWNNIALLKVRMISIKYLFNK